MAQPCSELTTHAWLKDTSGLGELIGYDFEKMDLSRLYRASDALYKHREALQGRLFGRAGRPVGGEAQTIRTLLAYLAQRFASRTPHTGKKIRPS